MIGMKDQCFGVEVEMTGLTRRQAAQALANYFGTEPYYVGGGYDKWSVKDPDGKAWSIMRPEIKSVIITSFTSKPARYIEYAISRSPLVPFSQIGRASCRERV